ncbi:MAG: hypothetical protein AB7P76_01470 [Candidatus Melainabacteria bacterium]
MTTISPNTAVQFGMASSRDRGRIERIIEAHGGVEGDLHVASPDPVIVRAFRGDPSKYQTLYFTDIDGDPTASYYLSVTKPPEVPVTDPEGVVDRYLRKKYALELLTAQAVRTDAELDRQA